MKSRMKIEYVVPKTQEVKVLRVLPKSVPAIVAGLVSHNIKTTSIKSES